MLVSLTNMHYASSRSTQHTSTRWAAGRFLNVSSQGRIVIGVVHTAGVRLRPSFGGDGVANESLPEDRQLSDQYLAALNFAGVKHRGQSRKGTDIPYLGHLLIVSGIVIEAGGSEVQATAALLHDVVEDQYVQEQEISDKFGDEVAAIVMACSDAAPAPGESKAPWRQRKEHHLARLQSCGPEVLLVAAADKIHNCEAILNDLDLHQDDPVQVWNRFNAAPADIAWYYASFLRIATAKGVHPSVVARLRRGVTALAGQAASAPVTTIEANSVVQ